MRDYSHIDQYINRLYSDIYPQPCDEGHKDSTQRVIDYWMSRMTTCKSVLDVGCGEGYAQDMFQRWGASYEGVALGEDVIVAQSLGRNVKRMDFSFLDYPDNSFDLIFARHSLEHSPMPLLTLFEWARVSRNWLGIVLPAPEWYTFKGRNHYHVMVMEQIRNLLDVAGWKVMWEKIDSLAPDKSHNPDNLIPHEYWIMSEKRR